MKKRFAHLLPILAILGMGYLLVLYILGDARMASGTLNQYAVWWEYLILVPGIMAMFVLWVAAIHDTWRSDRKFLAIAIFVIWPAAIVHALAKRKGWSRRDRSEMPNQAMESDA